MGLESGKIVKSGGKRKATGKVAGSLKEVELRRRQVFKPVLENPYTQQNVWPFVEPAVAETVMEFLDMILGDARVYKEIEKKNSKSLPEKPEVLQKITVGFNLTVGALEKQAQRFHIAGKDELNVGEIEGDDNDEGGSKLIGEGKHQISPTLQYIFVCKYDMASTLLVQHFPLLCVTALSNEKRVKLIQLPRGASVRISKAVGVANTTILGMSGELKLAVGLYQTIEDLIGEVEVPWLEDLLQKKAKLKEPSIKVLSTSAPITTKRNVQKKKQLTKTEETGEKREGGSEMKA